MFRPRALVDAYTGATRHGTGDHDTEMRTDEMLLAATITTRERIIARY
ncbi:hypothetical protein ABT369_29940 [Dactylosporangium sp. NPDC000244]